MDQKPTPIYVTQSSTFHLGAPAKSIRTINLEQNF